MSKLVTMSVEVVLPDQIASSDDLLDGVTKVVHEHIAELLKQYYAHTVQAELSIQDLPEPA